ncbi:MAG: hypothetical protein R3F20_17870 [Planctomycetota bacterium]
MRDEALISAYIDGELDERERAEVAAWITSDPETARLHADLVATRRNLRALYDEDLREAPRPRRPFLRRPGVLAFLATAAAVVATTVFFLFGADRAEASPGALLERAAKRYAERDQIELWVRFDVDSAAESPLGAQGQQALARFAAANSLRVLFGRGNRFLVMPTADPSSDWTLVDGLAGFDGDEAWRYDGRRERVVVRDGETIDSALTARLGGTDLVGIFSWDLARDLARPDLVIREVTWPADRRTRRRVFDVMPPPVAPDAPAEEKRCRWTSLRVTIDPEEGLIERIETDVRLMGMVTLHVSADVASADAPVDTRLFRRDRHVPAGTAVETRPGK